MLVKRMSLQEVRHTITGTDGDARSLNSSINGTKKKNTSSLQDIKAWPQLKNGDGASIQKFYNFLVKCESIVNSRELNPLDTPDVICMLLSKLLGKIRGKWVRAVMDVRTKEHIEGTLGGFIQLIHKETMLVNDPLFSKEDVDQYTDKKSSKQINSKKRINTFATHSKSDKEGKRDAQARDPLCDACNEDHLLDSCMVFMGKTQKNQTLDQQNAMLWLLSTYDQ